VNSDGLSRRYPWYDSWWLSKYTRARDIIRHVRPSALDDFDAAFLPLHTSPAFATRVLDHVVDETTFDEIRASIKRLAPTDLELHEAAAFGRFVVHDHPFFTRVQAALAPLVAAAVGEPVEPSYNFLGLYTAKGTCGVHLDAPSAKWTLDLCIAQTTAWPIYFSQVVPWPTELFKGGADEWADEIKRSPALSFEAYTLQPGQAVIFSGSSQWHYRERFPAPTGHCHLLFLHYIPIGTAGLLDTAGWAERFGVAELSTLI
jgi:hypothetical protein